MRKHVFLHRGGEGAAWRVALPVIFAVLALITTSLTFPWAASAQEAPGAPISSQTASPSPSSSPADKGDRSTTSATSPFSSPAAIAPTQGRTSTSARTTPAPSPASSEVRVPEAKAGPRAVQPFALNPGITVAITEIIIEGGTSDDQIKIGDSVEVHGTWDARSADPKPGDEFTIAFPAELQLTETTRFDLVGGEGEIWGTCEVSVPSNVMTCVLSDAVTDRDQEVHGSFYVYSRAVAYTTAETVYFNVTGDTRVPGQLPGEGGIGDGQVIGDAIKSGAFTPDRTAVRWAIDIPGRDLIALDTEGTGSVALTDTLSSNMELCDDGRLDATLLAGRPGDLTKVPGGASVTQSGGAGTPISIDIANGEGFRADQLYRVQYTSCTTSGEVDLPEEGDDDVVYSNSVDIGGDSIGVGIGQDWRPYTAPSKWGSLSANSRYSQLDWNIRVPGTLIAAAADHQVSIAETLSDNHEVCESGLSLTIRMQDYLPGPGGGGAASVNVTDRFTIDDRSTAGATSFSLVLTPKNIDDFDPEKYYLIQFRTCVTADEVPDTEDRFTNTAVVNGASITAGVNGPAFSGSKNGAFNLEPTTVNGEEQPAGTTASWALRVPGYDLENLDEEAVITDTFSDTLAVCEVGDDLKENLNLSVIARDFQTNGPNQTRNLTADTEVVQTAEGLQFTLPKEDGDYSREIVYDIAYTLCTSSGGMDSRGTVYSNTAAWEGKSISSSVRQQSGGGGTGEGVSRGSFSLMKAIDPFSEEFPVDETVFTVRVEEFAPGVDPETGTAEDTYEVEVKADGTPVNGFNSRGAGWQIRLTEIDLPHGNGVYFTPGQFRESEGVEVSADRTQAIVTLQPRTNVEVELVNNAQHGTATVTKAVVGDGAGELTGNEKFVVRANIDTGVEGAGTELREFTLEDGQFYDLGDLPIGTEVTFSEVQPVNTDRITWAEPVIVPETLIIGMDRAANTVSVTNEASITQGTFEISKDLRGPEAYNSAVPDSFKVLATWTNAAGTTQERTLKLPSNGDPIPFGENLPGGTQVTLTEVVPADGNGLAWGVPSYSGDVTIDDAGSAVVTIGQEPDAVTVRNFVDTHDGTLRLTKQVSGEAAEAADGAEFTVQARWRDGTSFRTEELTVTPGQSTRLGVDLPVGTEVTFTEVGLPEIAGVEWGDISWGTDPSGESWLVTNRDGTATGIVSDDPTDGRLITLTNEAQWKFGSVGFEKFVFDGEDPVPATEAGLPDGAEFEIQIGGIDPPLPAGVDFPAVDDRITLNAANDWSWESGDVLPRDTVITFSEVDPDPLDGVSWARPFYFVTTEAGEPGDRNTVEIVPGERAEVEIRNRPIPTASVEINKIVTGPKGGQVAGHESTTFQVTATWTDVDDEERSCILDVTPNGGMTPTAECDAAVVNGSVQFPLDTEITFIETGAYTDVSNVNWGDVNWSISDGSAEAGEIEGEPTGVVITLTGGDPVTLELENETSSRGLIFIPIPIPLPPLGSGSSTGSAPDPGPIVSDPTSGGTPEPGGPSSPDRPVDPQRPSVAGESGHNGAPGKPAPARPSKPGKSGDSALAVTGTNVAWLGGAALVLIAGGTWLMLRNRRDQAAE